MTSTFINIFTDENGDYTMEAPVCETLEAALDALKELDAWLLEYSHTVEVGTGTKHDFKPALIAWAEELADHGMDDGTLAWRLQLAA